MRLDRGAPDTREERGDTGTGATTQAAPATASEHMEKQCTANQQRPPRCSMQPIHSACLASTPFQSDHLLAEYTAARQALPSTQQARDLGRDVLLHELLLQGCKGRLDVSSSQHAAARQGRQQRPDAGAREPATATTSSTPHITAEDPEVVDIMIQTARSKCDCGITE